MGRVVAGGVAHLAGEEGASEAARVMEGLVAKVAKAPKVAKVEFGRVKAARGVEVLQVVVEMVLGVVLGVEVARTVVT